MFSRYFLVIELCLLKDETHVANYFTFKVKETNLSYDLFGAKGNFLGKP